MQLHWVILLAIVAFVAAVALIALLVNGAVIWGNRYRIKRAERALTSSAASFADEVVSIPGGEGIWQCIQCGTCTGSCPNANEMQYSPRKIIAMVRAGLKKEVLSSDTMWYCASCYLCTERCPRGVKVTELMYVLKQLASRYGFRYGPTGEPVMCHTFADLVARNGRVHELGLMIRFYLKTNPLAMLKMAPLGLKLMLRGRSPLMPKAVKGKEQLAAIIGKARALEAAHATEEVTK